MTIDEAIEGRRSIRSYRAQPVPEDLIAEILDLARRAPSSMNGQPWRFLVVRDQETKTRLAALKNKHCPAEKRTYPADFLIHAPAVILVSVERSQSHGREIENGVLATAFLLLAAQSRGLSGVYLSAYQKESPQLAEDIRHLLRIKEGIEPVTLVPIGFPADMLPPKRLRPLKEVIRFD
jgi:nitroreductase